MVVSTSYRVARQISILCKSVRPHAASEIGRTNWNSTVRCIHTTPIAFKTKENGAIIEEMFDGSPDNDLFSNPEQTPKAFATKPTSTKSSRISASNKKLTSTERTARFDNLYDSLIPHLTKLVPPPKNPASLADPAKDPAYLEQRALRKKIKPIRHTVWTHLIQLAQTEEELVKVAESFGKWRDLGHKFDETFAETFVARCESLRCPKLALQVFGDHAKFALPLSLPAARRLLHSLHANSLSDVLTASALYHVYSLPPVAEDLPSCALVLRAALKTYRAPSPKPQTETGDTAFSSENTASITSKQRSATSQVVRGLIPSLRNLLEKSKPGSWAVPRAPQEKTKVIVTVKGHGKNRKMKRSYMLEKLWVQWCLSKIHPWLARSKDNPGDLEWLRQWRIREGHLKIKPQPEVA
ncbi:hypothetical protein E1B28_006251 [Marasmius oreades]|uniref:Uncharacterized protein n=1 Tax=Marasmius oreades TaxID=181124 RepID=A0A9P7S5C2_9AGAR|nr:uncharacterized protein E1B28_006251 [Marasmius oreades]KAG7095513.1 hypothetical protein E1B28_006251 [Marasmius oreades]